MRVLAVLILVFLPFGGQADAAAFKAVYEAARDDDEAWARDLLRESEVVDGAVEALNRLIRLSRDLTVRFGAEDGPLYDPDLGEIWFPYAFVLEVADRFSAEFTGEDETERVAEATLDAVEHTLYHEVGHALIDRFRLPATGREEDAVDTLAALMIIALYENGADIAANAAILFGLESEDRTEIDEDSLMGEHSLDAQRYYAIACLIYGSDPAANADIAEDLEMSEERADLCVIDFERQREAWRRLLAPHLKDAGLF